MSDTIESYIWYEKHRPRILNELSLDKNKKKAFKHYIKKGQIPHLLFVGQKGSGKTTLSKILMDTIPSVSLKLNASGKEDRSIDTMQTKVRRFAKSQPPKGKIKIIFLDEADGILPPAQESLQSTIESNNTTCRFILTCNNVGKIIDTIQSRCTLYTFGQFPKKDTIKLCKNICKKEKVTANTKDIEGLIERFYPDMRSIVNNLQVACMHGSFDTNAIGVLNADPKEVCALLLKGHLFSIRKMVAGTTDFMFLYRYLLDIFIYNNGSDSQKADMAMVIVKALSNDLKVPDREINFMGCVIMLMRSLGINVLFTK